MWANSVWGLAGASFTCLLAYLTLADATPLASWYLAGTIIFGAASFIVLIWPPLRSRASVEPIHIIVLGLLIAAGGVGWLWSQHTASVAGPVSATWTASPPPPSHYGIAWNFDDPARPGVFFLGGGKGPGQETRLNHFQAYGKNVSDDFISCHDGYIRSDITGVKLPIFLYVKDKHVP